MILVYGVLAARRRFKMEWPTGDEMAFRLHPHANTEQLRRINQAIYAQFLVSLKEPQYAALDSTMTAGELSQHILAGLRAKEESSNSFSPRHLESVRRVLVQAGVPEPVRACVDLNSVITPGRRRQVWSAIGQDLRLALPRPTVSPGVSASLGCISIPIVLAIMVGVALLLDNLFDMPRGRPQLSILFAGKLLGWAVLLAGVFGLSKGLIMMAKRVLPALPASHASVALLAAQLARSEKARTLRAHDEQWSEALAWQETRDALATAMRTDLSAISPSTRLGDLKMRLA